MRRSFLALLACGLLLGASSSSTAAPPLDSGALLRKFEPVLLLPPGGGLVAGARGRVRRPRARREAGRTRLAGRPCRRRRRRTRRGCSFTPCYRFNLPCPLRGGDACYEADERDDHRLDEAGRLRPGARRSRGEPAAARLHDAAAVPRPLLALLRLRRLAFAAASVCGRRTRRDWESVTIGLSATLQPQFAAYSEHCSGTIRAVERT